MRRISMFALLVLMIAVAAGAQAPAGGPPGAPQGAPPPPTNLQVLPKDIPRPQLLATMQGIAAGLGVECNYCHVREGAGGRNDMALDEKPTKLAAREMLRMVADINTKVPAAVHKTPEAATRVQCVTCHRGVPIPKQLVDIVSATAAANGTPAAIAQYRDLRKQFYGAQAYDFSDAGLVAIATRAGMAKPEDGIAWLDLGLELNPKSARTHLAMAQIENRRGDKAAAIKHAEAALAIDPNDPMAKMMLEQLRK